MVSKVSELVTTMELAEIMLTNSEDNFTISSDAYSFPMIKEEFVIWAILDGILLVVILCGNILTILAVRYSRRLRSVISNQFVLSLAISDILVGLTLPYHLAFYLDTQLGESKHFCLLRFFLVIMACCVSIWNLIAIALDRYIAICYPLHYSRYMTRKIAICLMTSGWFVGFIIGGIPLFWNKWEYAEKCEFDQIFYPWYMVGVVTPVFSLVWLTMFFVYCRIWREASKQVKQLRVTGQQEGTSDWKSVQMVLLILGCFTVCWLPYFVVACSQIYKIIENSSTVAYMAAFTLAMSNSAMNPLIYAWKNSNFRQAFSNLLKCKSPDTLEPSQSMRSNLHRKSSSAQHQDTLSGAFPNYSTPPFMKKIEPITAMGITFEEDEDKISTHESSQSTSNTTKPKQLSNANSTSVAIKIESDMTSNSIIISATTLPLKDDIINQASSPINDYDKPHLPALHSPPSSTSLEMKQQALIEQRSMPSMQQQKKQVNEIDNDGIKMGNLIVNKLIENYGYDTKDIIDGGDNIKQKYKENFLNINDCSIITIMNENLKCKSKSANSIIITKHPNKSKSHGSICDHNVYRSNNELKKNDNKINVDSSGNKLEEKSSSLSRNLFPTFNFGRKHISRSLNSAVEEKIYEKCGENIYRKSTELNFPA